MLLRELTEIRVKKERTFVKIKYLLAPITNRGKRGKCAKARKGEGTNNTLGMSF
jgi:hypothetical protein